MNEEAIESDDLGPLLDEFLTRWRRGEAVAVDEYAERRPDLADEIRDLFPTLLAVERAAAQPGIPKEPASDGAPKSSDANRKNKPAAEAATRLGDYRVIREVGRGGMGIVYEAIQESLGRRVALKVLPNFATVDPKNRQRFRLEARAAALLHHPNIVPVFDVGEHDGCSYFAMQFIDGRGLDEVLAETRRRRRKPDTTSGAGRSRPSSTPPLNGAGAYEIRELAQEPDSDDRVGVSDVFVEPDSRPDPVSQAEVNAKARVASAEPAKTYFRHVAKMGIQAAEALAYAHEQGIVHRDIKPSNLLLDAQGTVWVADFGLAKVEDENLTGTGDVVGTLRYIAPERFHGWSDARGDVYSLGLTIYELLTLEPAFSANDRVRLLHDIAETEPRPPRRIDPRIPRDLETVVLKSIAKEPAGRYPSAREFADDLRRFLANEPIRARRTPLSERAWLWCRRNPIVAPLTVAVVALIALIAVGASISAVQLARSNAIGRQNLFDAYVSQAKAVRGSRRAGQRFAGLDAIRRASELAPTLALDEQRLFDLRNHALACLVLPDVRRQTYWSMLDYREQELLPSWGFDADLERYARETEDGRIVIHRVRDNQEIQTLPGIGRFRAVGRRPVLRLSPSGRFLAVCGLIEGEGAGEARDILQVFDLSEGRRVFQTRPLSRPDRSALNAIGFSPDSRYLAFISEDLDLTVLDTANHTSESRFHVGHDSAFLHFSPSGAELALATAGQTVSESEVNKQGGVAIVDAHSGKPLHRLPHPHYVFDVAWSTAGTLLATACFDHNLYVWDLADPATPKTVCRGHLENPFHVAFAPDGATLVSTSSTDRSTRVWNAHTGVELLQGAPGAVQFSRDGRQLGFANAGNSIEVCEFASGRECRTLHSPLTKAGPRQIISVAFSPDGNRLAAGSYEGCAIWELASTDRARALPHKVAFCVTFDPTGNHLFVAGNAGLRRASLDVSGAPPSLLEPLKVPELRDDELPFSDVSLARDGRTMVVVLRLTKAVVIDADSMKIRHLLSKPHNVYRAAISPDAHWVATATPYGEDVFIYNVQTGALSETIRARRGDVPDIQFSPDGRFLILSMPQQYRFLHVNTWQTAFDIPRNDPTVGQLALSDDGRWFAIADRDTVTLLDSSNRQPIATLVGPTDEQFSTRQGRSLAFSPGCDELAVGTMQGNVLVWDLELLRAQLAPLNLNW